MGEFVPRLRIGGGLVNPLDAFGAQPNVEGRDPTGEIRRLLIIGMSGYLGSALATGLREEFEVIGTYSTRNHRIEGVTSVALDCTNGAAVLDTLRRFRPEAVLYCAGLTDSAKCTENPALADTLHFKAPTVCFKILPMVLRFLLFSPDEAIGLPPGEPPYSEDAPAVPSSVLGKTRHQGEVAVFGHKRYTAVFRNSEVFGEPFGADVLAPTMTGVERDLHWVDLLHRRLARGQTIELSRETLRSYLYIGDLVRAVRLYLRKAPIESVLYNCGASSTMSQFDFGRKLATAFGYNPALVKSSFLGAGNHSLSPRRFEEAYDFKFQSIDEGIREYAERYRTGHTKSWL